MNKKYMLKAIEQAQKAYKMGDVPVGAIIVKNNKIIAKDYNRKEKNHNATAHAEMLVINKACKKLKTWHLEDCTLYITLEPCLMCTGAIIQSRIGKIFYAAENPNYGELNNNIKYNNNIKIEEGICKNESKELLKSFFKDIRK